MNRLVRTLAITLAATLTFAAFADEEELHFGIFADDGRIVGTVEVDPDDDGTIEVELLRGFEGFVRLVVPGADGVNVIFDGAIGPDGLVVIVDGFFVDAAEFMARFGADFVVRIEFEDELDEDDLRGDLGRDGDDDDDDRDDDDDDDDDDEDDDDEDDDDDDDGDDDDDSDD